jgi:esterase/lipase
MSEKISQKIAIEVVRRKLQLLASVSPRKAAEKAFTLFCTPERKQVKGIPAIEDKGTACSLKAGGYTIFGYRWNHPAKRKVLVAHGFESSLKNFEGFVTPLVNKGYEVIAFDAPAHGQSEGKEIILPLYIKTLAAIYENYGPFDAYIGHSLGGLAIAHFLETIPHDASVKVVFIAPATEITPIMDRFFKILHLNGKVRKAFDELSTEKTGISPEDASIRRAMHNIHATVLWLHDIADDITPYHDMERVRGDNFHNINFVTTQGLGHRKIYRDPQTVQQVIDFL